MARWLAQGDGKWPQSSWGLLEASLEVAGKLRAGGKGAEGFGRGKKSGTEEHWQERNCSWWRLCPEPCVHVHQERDELRDANKSVGTRKKFGMGRGGRDMSRPFEAMHCCVRDVVRIGVTEGSLWGN